MTQKTLADLDVQELKAAAWDLAAAIEGISGRLNAVRGELAKRELVEQGAAGEKEDDSAAPPE